MVHMQPAAPMPPPTNALAFTNCSFSHHSFPLTTAYTSALIQDTLPALVWPAHQAAGRASLARKIRFLLHATKTLQSECRNLNDLGLTGQERERAQSLTSHHSSAYIGKTATIEVGTDANKQTFYVYRDLLSFYSGCFRAALNGGFTEAESGVIKLETEEPVVFEGFVKWLYTKDFRSDEINKHNNKEYFMSIVKLWIFADCREIPLLMNEMIDRLQEAVHTVWLLPRNTIREAYSNTTARSALRRMIVDTYKTLGGIGLGHDMTKDDGYDYRCYPKQFLYDLMPLLLQVRGQRNLTKEEYNEVDMCPSFHVHEEGVSCTRKRKKRSSDEMGK